MKWRAVVVTMGALASAVVISTVVVAASPSGGTAIPKTPVASFRADAKLLRHIPDGVRATCLLGDNVATPAPGDHYVATLECHPDPETTITYRQHATVREMTSEFENRYTRGADDLVLDDEEASCESLEPYTVDGDEVGSSMCEYDDDDGSVSITWSYEPLALVGILERDDGDATAARATWTDDAGPDRGVHPIPHVLSRAAARAAAAELLALIPDARANGCRATDLASEKSMILGSSPTGAVGSPALWLDAEVVCKTEFPTAAVYRRYRDDDAYAAAYDDTHFLQFAESGDPACPDGTESSWSLDDTPVGRVACYYLGVAGEGEAHLRWTYDPDRIVAEAYALDAPSAQPIYDWWETDAGPQP